MLTDLVQIRRLGEKKRVENFRLRMHLKRRNYQERRANCCRVATIKVIDRDVEKLARRLNLAKDRFLAEYTREDPEEGRVLKRNEGGCVFLEGNLCSVYDVRPHTCALFPHLARGAGSLVSRLWEMPDRACYCPIVYNALEAWKADLGFR